jgi:hypothetical protein
MISQKTIIPRSRAKTSIVTELGLRNLGPDSVGVSPPGGAAALATAPSEDDEGVCDDDDIELSSSP